MAWYSKISFGWHRGVESCGLPGRDAWSILSVPSFWCYLYLFCLTVFSHLAVWYRTIWLGRCRTIRGWGRSYQGDCAGVSPHLVGKRIPQCYIFHAILLGECNGFHPNNYWFLHVWAERRSCTWGGCREEESCQCIASMPIHQDESASTWIQAMVLSCRYYILHQEIYHLPVAQFDATAGNSIEP